MHRILIVLLVFFCSCGAAGGEYERSDYASAPAPAAPRGDIVLTSASAESDEGFLAKREKSASADAPRKSAEGGASPEAPVGIDQKLVKNAYLTIQFKDEKQFPDAIKRAEDIARNLSGYVASTTRSSITFKVPTGRLDEALAAVGELGKVKHRDVTAVDVTASYVDLAIRIENLRKLRVRLQELVNQGKTVEEILRVENELARVTSQLESLEGQMRVMENQTTFATVSLTFTERVRPGPIGWVFYGLYRGVKWLFVWD